MPDIAQAYVQIIPTAKGITGELEKAMGGEADQAGKTAGKSFTSSFSSAIGSAGRKLSSIGTKMTVGITAGLTGAAVASTAAWKEVDAAMDTITTKTGASGDALEDMQKRAQKIATTIPISFQEAGDAIGEVNTRFGLTGDALQDLSAQFTKFAELNGTDVSSSVDAVQASMAAFGLSASDAGNMLDVLNKAGQDTGVNVVQLASDLKTNAGTLKTFGYNASDAAMLLANLSKNGVDTSSAMMGLKKVYQESIETGKPMSAILGDLTTKLQNSKTATEGAQEAADIFGARAASSLIPALQDGRLSFDALGTSIDSFTGSVTDTYNETLDPLDQMTVNMNMLKQAGADLVNAGAPLISQAFSELTTTLQTAQPVFQQFLSTFSENGQTIASVIAPMLSTTFQTLGNVVNTLTTAWNGLSDSQQQIVLKLAGVALAAGPTLAIGGKAISIMGSVAGAGGKLVSGIGGLIGKLGSIGKSAGSAASTLSTVGSAASGAAGPVGSAGTSVGTLAKNAVGLVAAGAGILLAAAGISLLAKSAIEIANAGAPAAVAMVALTAAVAGMAIGAAALAPALTAGAVGLVAFGAGVTLVGVGILAATSGVALLASQLPNIAQNGDAAAKALTKIGTAMVKTSAGAVTLAAGITTMLVPVAGAAVTIGTTDIALIGLAATFTASAAGAGLLGTSMKLVASAVTTISGGARQAGTAMQTMVASVGIVNTAIDGLKTKLSQVGQTIGSVFTQSAPTAEAGAKAMTDAAMTAAVTSVTAGGMQINTAWSNALQQMNITGQTSLATTLSNVRITMSTLLVVIATTNLSAAWESNLGKLNNTTKTMMSQVEATIKSSLNNIQQQFANTKLEFNKNIKLPHFSFDGSFDPESGSTPSVRVDWYRKAYDNAYMLNGATIFGAMNGHLLGGGEGNGSELVIGTDKLIEVIREAVGRTGYTQNVTINSPQELSPAEVARQTRNATRQMVLALSGV